MMMVVVPALLELASGVSNVEVNGSPSVTTIVAVVLVSMVVVNGMTVVVVKPAGLDDVSRLWIKARDLVISKTYVVMS